MSNADAVAVRQLIEADPRLVNATDERNRTPLHLAVDAGNSEITNLLLNRGANVDALDAAGASPLHVAARQGNSALAAALLNGGANANLRSNDRLTALYLAARGGHEETVDLPLQREVDLELDATISPTLAEAAARGAMEQLFRRLMESKVGVEDRVLNDGSLLHAAAEGGSVEIVQMLLDLGLNLGERDFYGWTPLHYAAERGHEDVSTLLVSRGADVNAVSVGGHTPLSVTNTYGMDAEAQLLESHGATRARTAARRQGPWFGEEVPGSERKVFALDIVSSNRWEHGTVTFSPDGREAFWESVFTRENSGRILWSRWEDDGWSSPEYAPFSTDWAHGDDVPFFSTDGERLYFVSQRALEGVDEGGVERIWVVDRTASGWGAPRIIEGGPNTKGMHWQFSVAENGSIYFGSADPGGEGSTDIYVSRLENGAYQNPENLGPVINHSNYDGSPFISPDESYIIYTRLGGPEGVGGSDLYISFKTPDGTWTPPLNMGDSVNTPDFDMCAQVSSDGRFLFWHINQPRPRNADNYWIDADMIEELKAKAFRSGSS